MPFKDEPVSEMQNWIIIMRVLFANTCLSTNYVNCDHVVASVLVCPQSDTWDTENGGNYGRVIFQLERRSLIK
jgi:hypothetical protein